MTYWQMYLFVKLDTFVDVLRVATAFSLVPLLAVSLMSFINHLDGGNTLPVARKVHRWLLATSLLLAPLAVLMPSQKQLAAILLVPTVVNNEEAQRYSIEFLGILRAEADKYIDEAKGALKEELK